MPERVPTKDELQKGYYDTACLLHRLAEKYEHLANVGGQDDESERLMVRDAKTAIRHLVHDWL